MSDDISRRELCSLLTGLFTGTLIGNSLHAEVPLSFIVDIKQGDELLEDLI